MHVKQCASDILQIKGCATYLLAHTHTHTHTRKKAELKILRPERVEFKVELFFNNKEVLHIIVKLRVHSLRECTMNLYKPNYIV